MPMSVAKRKVFYLGGFDPRGGRHYYGWYHEAAARYAALTGKPIAVGARAGADWPVHNAADGVQADYHFLAWDDIVRRAWIREPLRLILRSARMYGYYLRHLRWKLVMALPRGPVFTLFSPLITLLGLPLLLALLLWIWLPFPLALLAGVVAFLPLARRYRSLWLLRFFVFNQQLSCRRDDALMERIDQFAVRIARALEEDADEVLLVGHSNGSILMVYLLDRLAAHTGGALPEHLRVLTLGQCLPLITLLDEAPGFTEAFARVAALPVYWCDIGAPPDGAAYAKIDPFLPDHPARAVRMHSLNPRFFAYDDAATYRRLKRDKYRLHFRYLMTGDKASPLDYVALTAGPRPLPETVAEYRQ